MLGTGIERDIFLHYFIMILCIFAIFILFHMSDDKFIFILYLFALECRFKGAHLSAMYFFFFFGLMSYSERKSFAVKNKGSEND